MSDFRWMSQGGVLLDGTGDLAMGSAEESLVDMVRTRLKADLHGWKLYAIGADLDRRIGDAMGPELEATVRRQIVAALTNQFLKPNAFDIRILSSGRTIDAYVYVDSSLVATVQASRDTGLVKVL